MNELNASIQSYCQVQMRSVCLLVASFSGISTQAIDQWKEQLSEHEIWWIELHCRKGMELAGYPLQTDAKFSLGRWLKRLPDESWGGYIRARRASIFQWLGRLKDCRYDP
jgi:hypothetical protein